HEELKIDDSRSKGQPFIFQHVLFLSFQSSIGSVRIEQCLNTKTKFSLLECNRNHKFELMLRRTYVCVLKRFPHTKGTTDIDLKFIRNSSVWSHLCDENCMAKFGAAPQERIFILM
uniref:Uncharacterized protein n=1 Tax=Poecilia reticulata TaxID=8081 RepID=A0A3P9NUC8_POERE